MKRSVVHTSKVPAARVPLSQAIKVGDWVFASGQLGFDPHKSKRNRARSTFLEM